MLIKLRDLKGLALTEKCSDPTGFMRAAGTRDPEKTARHLAECPACRKVVLDTVRALSSSGIPGGEPAVEGKTSEVSNAGEEELQAITAKGGAGIESGSGKDFVIVGRDRMARAEIGFRGVSLTMEIEHDSGSFVVRLCPGEKTGGMAMLRDSSGVEVSPPRKIESRISWSGLKPGAYSLTLAGERGLQGVRILLT